MIAKLVAASLALVIGLATEASATLFFDTVVPDQSGADAVSSAILAQSFTTGSVALSLTAVQLKLSGDGNPGTNAASIGVTTVSLLTDSSKTPGAVIAILGTVSDTSLENPASVQTVVPASLQILAANTTYWIELSAADPATLAAWTYTSVAATGEYYYEMSGNAISTGETSSYEMALTGEDVDMPEPASLLLVGVGLLGLASVRRRA